MYGWACILNAGDCAYHPKGFAASIPPIHPTKSNKHTYSQPQRNQAALGTSLCVLVAATEGIDKDREFDCAFNQERSTGENPCTYRRGLACHAKSTWICGE